MKPKLKIKILLFKAARIVCWVMCFICMCAFRKNQNHFFIFFSALFFCIPFLLSDLVQNSIMLKFWKRKNDSERITLIARNKKMATKSIFPALLLCYSTFLLLAQFKAHWLIDIAIMAFFSVNLCWWAKIKDEKNKIKEAIWQ